MDQPCDHRSVGVLISNPLGRILLIERARPPWGWAPPSGHVDSDIDSQGNPLWRTAALREVKEEVGLSLPDLHVLTSGVQGNSCRRGGHWHDWVIFTASTDAVVSLEATEAKAFQWADRTHLQALAARTDRWLEGHIKDRQWRADPGLEYVWVTWLRQLASAGLGPLAGP